MKEKEKEEKKEPFKNLCKSPEDSGASCVLDTKQSDRVSLNLCGFGDNEGCEEMSEN